MCARLSTARRQLAPRGVRFSQVTLGGVSGEWAESKKGAAAFGALLYLHGGGYVGMSARTHRAITGGFALRGFRVFCPDYRLGPEHIFPAALDDVVSVWRALRKQIEGPIFVSGDSSGGGLAVALLLTLRDQRELAPAAACLFSPWTDFAVTGASLTINRDRDPMQVPACLRMLATAYVGQTDPRMPLVSPIYGDLAGLPPMVIFVKASTKSCSTIPNDLRNARLWRASALIFALIPTCTHGLPLPRLSLEGRGLWTKPPHSRKWRRCAPSRSTLRLPLNWSRKQSPPEFEPASAAEHDRRVRQPLNSRSPHPPRTCDRSDGIMREDVGDKLKDDKFNPQCSDECQLALGFRWRLARKGERPLSRPSSVLYEIFDVFGAGEGIRTLDPNLGKVVLYH